MIYENEMLFDLLPNFSVNEKWGDYNKMSPVLLVLLQKLRIDFGKQCWFKINVGFKDGGHSETSQHYVGKAVDFSIANISFEDAFIKMEKLLDEYGIADKCGLGVYPHWNKRGFHLDVRGTKARWGRLATGTYVAAEVAMLSYS